jgi:YbbR domain-containing protein
MRARRLFTERYLLLVLAFLIAVTSWYYVVSSENPRVPRTTSKLVAVIPAIAGEPAYGYGLLGVRVAPPTIIIAGAPEVLAQIDSVRTDPVDVTGATKDVVREVGLVELPEVVHPSRVRVVVQVAPAITVTVVRGVKVRVEHTPAGLAARVEPGTVEVQVEGPLAILSKLRPEELVARVEGTELSEGRRHVAPTVQTPPNVKVLSIRPVVVQVVVIRKGG